MSFFADRHFDFISFFLGLNLGVLLGMCLVAFFIGACGCYEGCHLQNERPRKNDSDN